MGVGKYAKRSMRRRAALPAGALTFIFVLGNATLHALAWARVSHGRDPGGSPSPSPSPSESLTPTPSSPPDSELDPSPSGERRVASLHGGSPTSKKVAAVTVPKTHAPAAAPIGITFPLVAGVTVSADVAAVPTRPVPGSGGPLDAASAVLWILLAVPLFLTGALPA